MIEINAVAINALASRINFEFVQSVAWDFQFTKNLLTGFAGGPP